MTQFAIVIPFRPKIESADWKGDIVLLHRTIESVLQQTYPHFSIYVIYTDAPENRLYDPRVKYVEFPYGYQPLKEMKNRQELVEKFKSEKKTVRRWDKARKLCYGSKLAKQDRCNYIMALDSDDLLSKHFLAYLNETSNNNKCKGWYLDKGYLYKQGSNFLIRVPKHMCGLNGSTHMLHADLVEIPDFHSLEWNDYNLFTDHGWIRGRVKKYYQAELQPVPDPMLVYVVHRSNMSKVNHKEFGFHFKAIVKRIIRGIPLTEKLREEFNLSIFREV
ncbi:hypothetical protein WG954_07535 [Lacibacter sp. H375]|uniref:hypothetical protein n=1 Tax=Lacibacter sp. H375 TaxID=3133424 RepID=UPI0030BDD98E